MNRVINDITTQSLHELFLEQGVPYELVEYKRGEWIYENGDGCLELFRIKRGYIKTGSCDESGRMAIWYILQQGDWLGNLRLEPHLLSEFAITLDHVELEVYQMDNLKMIDRNRLRSKLFDVIDRRLALIEFQLTNILFNPAEQKLINFLIFLAHFYGKTIDGVSYIRRFLTHEEMASLLGTARQTITNHFNHLRKLGLLEYDRYQMKLFWQILKDSNCQDYIHVDCHFIEKLSTNKIGASIVE